MGRSRALTCLTAIAGLLAAGTTLAQTAPAQTTPAQTPADIPNVIVIGRTPMPGTGIDIDKIPGNAQSLSTSDLTANGTARVTDALQNKLGSVSISDNIVDAFQPDILFRGFEASPQLGTPQGLAVYQNGVRINEAFGDTVNWDLIPDMAIDRVDVVSSNPVYGLNALGGAVIVSMKDGFKVHGGELEIEGGSFGERSIAGEYGQQSGIFGLYVTARALDRDGWRLFSPDAIRQFYADFGIHAEKFTFDASFTGDNNRMFGQSPAPIQEVAVSRALIFTSPQNNFNQLEFLTLNGSYQATDQLSIQSNFYYREYRQTVANGDTSDYATCASGTGLCQDDGTTPITDQHGQPIPDISNGGTIAIGQNDAESVHAVGFGGALQASYDGPLFGFTNHAVVGASIDHATVDFQTSTQLGIIDSALSVHSGGIFVETPEGNPDFTASPVNLHTLNRYYGIFATDTVDLTDALSFTASGRFNVAEIDLFDQRGTDLNGNNQYNRFNPAVGATYKLLSNLTAYAGYSEANRAPTASEIECSNPLLPCLLPTSLASDPPNLKQVISHTYEAGLRGRFGLTDFLPGRFHWNAGLFRTDLDDDIYGISTSLSTGFFQNIGATRRQGAEASLSYADKNWSFYASYSYIDATFQSPLTINSPSNPAADVDGNINIKSGDKLPGIPQNRVKAGVDYRVTDAWSIGATLNFVSDQYYKGDEANQNGKLPAYQVVDLHSTYEVTDYFEVFGTVQNVFDSRYATFGTFGDPTGINAPGIPAGAATNDPGVDNRFISPAPPVAAFGGVRIRF